MRLFLPQPAMVAIWLAMLATAGAAATPTPSPIPAKPSPTPAAEPHFIGKLSLVRYDMPLAFSDGYAPTHQVAKKKDGEVTVAWPDFTFDGHPIFRGKSEEQIPLKLRRDDDARSPFEMAGDDVVQPGNHWLRAIEWRHGIQHIYTADGTARTANAGATMTGRYELWLFPVIIEGEGGPVVKNVELKTGQTVIFKHAGPWRSLTLLLPQNEPDKPYVLTIDGRPPITFQAGLQHARPGNPREVVMAVNTFLSGDGPKISVRNLAKPEEFPHPKEWAADVAALGKPLPPAPPFDRGSGVHRYLGGEVPVSPLTLYAMALPHGMSYGFFKKGTDPEAYAKMLRAQNYDTVFDPVNVLPAPGDAESFEKRAAALARSGVRLGLEYDDNWTRPAFQHPNLAFLAHTLPDWHAPLYRSLSLATQRFARLPNFAGICVGANNAGYVSDLWWTLPIPSRPWGEAMINFLGTPQPRVPRAPSLGPPEFTFERPVKTELEFSKYVGRYETSFEEYSYFADAVREVSPRFVFTTGSFGSAPSAGARGGWPWASMPGRTMCEGLPVQQAYDANETHAAKPLHAVALADRLRSYFPKKTTWGLIDDHHFLYGREGWQRACALMLTRGVQGVGTNFLAHSEGDGAHPDAAAAQAEMNAWMHKFGGVYARTQPEPTIGVFYGYTEAVQRRVLLGEQPPEEELLRGSQEGKVVEALFICQAAGWPARVITHQELLRGPLPASMKAILLVGLDQPDATRSWSAGLEPMLQKFLDRGGRILADDESVCPVSSTKTGMKVAAYVTQMNVDPTPMLFARNVENISTLRNAMQDVAPPVATSGSETIWTIPTRCADVQYLTVVNQGYAEGEEAQERLLPADPRANKPEFWKLKGNASLFVKPQTGALKWSTDRPIYDVRLGKKITAEEAAQVDLTKDAFQWYALPPREITKPEVSVEKGVSGFYEARVTMSGGPRMGGVPVELTVTGPNDTATVYGVTEISTRLPLRESDDGEYTITATELLTGLSETAKVTNHATTTVTPRAQVQVREMAVVTKFAARKKVPLTIALTPEQEKDSALEAQAKALKDYYQKKGRTVSLGSIKPGGVVESLQPIRSPNRYPQWKTSTTDLVLFGTPANNVLLLDQARGEVLPRNFAPPGPTEAALLYTRSPYVGECDALDIIATDTAGFTAAVQKLVSAQ
ncbi:MAG TPA: hypothetical protein VGM54_07530 [Chthoniobacter sp.]